MKSIFIVAAGLAVLAAGCASTPSSAYVDNADTQKVQAVERVARANGIEVHWINYPKRRPQAVETAAPAVSPTGS